MKLRYMIVAVEIAIDHLHDDVILLPHFTPRSSSKISATRRVFNSLLGVSSGDETLCLMLDILLEITV